MPMPKKSLFFSSFRPIKIQPLFLRIKKALERNGVFLTIIKGGRLFFFHTKRRIHRFEYRHQYYQRVKELATMIEQHDGFFDLIHIPIGWNTLMFQRFQHLSLQFASLGGFILYGGNPEVDKDLFVYQVHSPNLCVFDATDPYLVDKILFWLQKKTQPKIIRIQSIDLRTTLSESLRFLDLGFIVIYEYIDMISPIITGIVPRHVSFRHLSLLKDNRVLIVGTADRLIEEVKSHRTENYLLNTNGVDVTHWRRPQIRPPNDLREIVASGNTIVGYHGTLAEWLDYGLLWAIAETGKYELVLLGLEHDSSFKKSGLKKHPRVHFLGSKSYFELNVYVNYYNVAILPFIKSELTDSISPVKIFEYMAARKPIVTTNLFECTKYKSCLIAKNRNEFLDNLELAVRLRTDQQYLALLDTEAQNNSWKQKAIDLLNFAKAMHTQ